MKMAKEGRPDMGELPDHDGSRRRSRRVAIPLLAGCAVAQIAFVVLGASHNDSERGLAIALEIAALVLTPATLALVALGVTWAARRSASRALAHGVEETSLLTGRTLSLVRGAVLLVIVAAAVLYVADAFALWDEAHAIEWSNEYGESETYFGLRPHERALLTGSSSAVPLWYPVFVVVRQIVLDAVAMGLALLIFSRRPHHWMAYVSTLFIVVAPWAGHLLHMSDRLDGTSVGWLAIAFRWLAIVVLGGMLWLFPDGRFRRTFLTYVGAMALVLGSGWALFSIGSSEGDALGTASWITFMISTAIFGLGGIALQGWRYRHTPLTDRRLARWNLAMFVSIPLWLLPFDALHDLYGENDDAADGLDGFVWEQAHETLYLAAPVLLGFWVLFLVRRQGWWDFETLWNRTAVYGIGLGLLAGIYGGAFGFVTVAASPLGDSGEQVVAVLAATAAVAFAYAPLLARVRTWVDERWFPGRLEVERVSSEFGDDVRRATTPDGVPDLLEDVVRRSLETDDVRLWLTAGGEPR